MNAPEIQFDPAAARFGAARSQKRLEDDRLLVGKGLFSDDRRFENEAALVVVRSPHAHARIKSVDLAAGRAAPGVLAVWTLAELAADGVKHIPVSPLFKRPGGLPMSAIFAAVILMATVMLVAPLAVYLPIGAMSGVILNSRR